MENRIQIIDILRGIAAFMVFLFHMSAVAGFDKKTLPPIYIFEKSIEGIPNFFSLGATGVSLFFVISGLVLTLKYSGALQFNHIKYYNNRFYRIVPVYWFSILFSIVTAFIFKDISFNYWDILLHIFFLHGISGAYFLSINGALWSMATEVQFYLIFPFLLLLFIKYRPVVVFSISVIVVLLFRYLIEDTLGNNPVVHSISDSSLVMYQIPGRLAEFTTGILLGLWIKSNYNIKNWVILTSTIIFGLIALVARFLNLNLIVDTAFGITYGLLILGLLKSRSIIENRRFSNTLASFGKISYSFF